MPARAGVNFRLHRNDLLRAAVKGQEDIDRLADEPGHRPLLAELEMVKSTDLIGAKDWLVHGASPLQIGFSIAAIIAHAVLICNLFLASGEERQRAA
jgi:hypothetical protein